ncbi:HEAT repeat domain-containing protein [Sorangium sp. So ce1151]|uniref:HEAT repeat domain-containing protein n=1 Tax=Sorangium sp. So ce1151 TaxID=3133332 RepID=UPI003F63F17A
MTKAIDWKKLKHARGPATRVPAQVEQLVGNNSDRREDAFSTLEDTLIERGQWFDASAPALALLLDAVPDAPEPDLLLVLAADILGADHVRAWLAPSDEALPVEAVGVHDVALERREALLGWVRDARPAVRAGAAVVLAMLPEIRGETLPLLKRQAGEEPDTAARASALIALGRLGEGDEEVDRIVEGARGVEHPLVRGAAAVAWLRLDGGRSFAGAAEGLAGWLEWKPAEPWTPGQAVLPWFGGLAVTWYKTKQPLEAAPSALAALARQRGATRDLVDTAVRLGSGALSGVAMRRLSAMVLDLGGFLQLEKDYVALPEELSAEQRDIAKGLAATKLVPIAGLGLPACGASRRRWIGLEPPGPLERHVEVEIAGDRKALPVWRAWRELNLVETNDDSEASEESASGPIPRALDARLTAHDRWQAIVEIDAESYGFGCYMDPDELERQLAAIPQDEDLLRRVAEVADDLAARFAAGAREGIRMAPSPSMSAMLLLPLVRAGRRLEQRWEPLIHVGDEPQAREIFQALAPERREAWLEGYFEREMAGRGTMVVASLMESVLPVMDLTLTPRTAGFLGRVLAGYKKEVPRGSADQLLGKLRALAQGHSDVLRALGAES